ncbi:MAG: PHB depolymerase family esterase [Pseudomonadota bacterium]
MLKGLSRLWLRGLKKAGKVQKSQSRKLVKSLLAVPAAARPPRAKPVSRKAPAAKVPLGLAAIRLPGKWLASYHSTFADDGALPARRMNYWLYLPGAGTAMPPLVVMLHGCEQTAVQFSQGTRMNQLAEEKGFAVLYPQQSLRGHPNRCWHWYEKSTQDGGGDVAMIASIIEKVVRKHAMDRSRVYIAGLSAGASMANIVALNFPHLIAAVGMHSGTVFGAGHSRMGAYAVMQTGAGKLLDGPIKMVMDRVADFPPMPAILLHGQADRVVRPINLAQSAHQFRMLNRLTPQGEKPVALKAGGKPGSRQPAHAYKIYDHYAGRKLMLRVCDVIGLEHEWSGGDGTIRFNSGAGPDASKLMWDFFARHQR